MTKRLRAFDSIESAHEYISLLLNAVEREEASALKTLEGSTGVTSRHRDAWRLADYKLRALTSHLVTSRRLLNDLRTLRRYLLDERAQDEPAPKQSAPNDLQTSI